MWGGGLAGAEGRQVQAAGVPRGAVPGTGHSRSHPGRRQGSSSASGPGQRAAGEAAGGSGAPLDSTTLGGPGGQAQKRCRRRRAGPQEAEHSLHGVQGDHVGGPGGAQDGQRESRARAPLPHPGALLPQHQERPLGGGGGSGVGRFLTLLTGPGRAVGDDPRHTGAGGRAAEGRGVVTSCVVSPGFMC